ncbi:hypothetical protein ACUN0C_18760 [Faunimonas sp. B44]|uniref:hypothetical protein n=1 Tax=Faunimonas sp. B44 TaxID=3461493 RepID=UPI004044907D
MTRFFFLYNGRRCRPVGRNSQHLVIELEDGGVETVWPREVKLDDAIYQQLRDFLKYSDPEEWRRVQRQGR